MENWVKICSIYKRTEDTLNWLYELLDEEKIPYKKQIEEKWEGSFRMPNYEQMIDVYIPNEYKEKVEKYLNEFYSSNSNVVEQIEELKELSDEKQEKEWEKKINNRHKFAKKIVFLMPLIILGTFLIMAIIGIFIGILGIII